MMTTAATKTIPIYKIAATPEGFALYVNDAPLKTPGGKTVILPTQPLAVALAEEWRTKPQKINPAFGPLTQLAATALDIVSKDRDKIINQLAAYVGSELLCHRADNPPQLAELQQRTWQPLLDWCAQRFDIYLKVGKGIMPIEQPTSAHQAVKRVIEGYDNFYLAGLRQAVDVSGSLILGLALTSQHLKPEQVLKIAELDAYFQMQQWGETPAIVQRHRDNLTELLICENWFGYLKKEISA